MGRLRRFVLVATTVAGFLLWVAQPFHVSNARWIPIGGLIAAIVSAATTWAPQFATTTFARIALSGFVSFGLLALLALASSDLRGFGVGFAGNAWVMILSWMVITGVIAQLVIRKVEPGHIYWGFALVFATALPFLPPAKGQSQGEYIGYGCCGVLVLGLVPLIAAKITRAMFRRRLEDTIALPDARAL
jgi:hypothetical protein